MGSDWSIDKIKELLKEADRFPDDPNEIERGRVRTLGRVLFG